VIEPAGTLARALVFVGCSGTMAACAAVPHPVQTTELDWQAARAELASLRAALPDRPYGVVVKVALREPRTGRIFAARGAIAVDPHRAMRMILLGPGGATALDAWVTPDAYRFEVPAIGLLRRGGVRAESGLPVEFFRWWFLAPFEGRLLASFSGRALAEQGIASCDGRLFLLRSGGSTVSLCDTGPAPTGPRDIEASRRGGGTLDHLSFHGRVDPRAGDRAVYEEARSGVRVEIEVESPADSPDPLAFHDPDLEREP
jgi:hypothetical protein